MGDFCTQGLGLGFASGDTNTNPTLYLEEPKVTQPNPD